MRFELSFPMAMHAPSGQHSSSSRQSRNALCNCGSGEKYKRCCGAVSDQSKPSVAAASANAMSQQHFQRGRNLLQDGQTTAAMTPLLMAIQSNPRHFEAHHALGIALMKSGRIADAAGILSQAVALRPDSSAAHWDLGAAYDSQNLHEQAINAYRRAVELAPKLGDVHVRLGQLYAMYSRMQEAANSFDRAADAKPKTTWARLYRADAALLRGDIAAGEQWARKAIALEPDSDAGHGTLAGLLFNQGRFDEASAAFEAALRLNSKAAKCWDGLAHCRKYSATDAAIIDRMGAVLQRGELNDLERMTINFAIGKVCDDSGDYARAMRHFDAANAIRARDVQFDRTGLVAMVDRTIAQFTTDFMTRHAANGIQNEKPIFIVGMYRSGTTLVEQILSSHPDVAAGGELTVWSPLDIEIDDVTGEFDPVRSGAAIANYLYVLERIGPLAARVTDKLPPNLFRLGAIHALMPKAKVILCQRDPIDTCLSIYSTLFGTRVPFAARKSDLVFYYRQYRRIIAHWKDVMPPGTILEVQYETLIADREAETMRLIAFTGLDWNASCLRPEQNKRAISTSSAWQVRQPVYTTSLQRWRRYEPWLGELLELLEHVP